MLNAYCIKVGHATLFRLSIDMINTSGYRSRIKKTTYSRKAMLDFLSTRSLQIKALWGDEMRRTLVDAFTFIQPDGFLKGYRMGEDSEGMFVDCTWYLTTGCMKMNIAIPLE